VYFNITYQS